MSKGSIVGRVAKSGNYFPSLNFGQKKSAGDPQRVHYTGKLISISFQIEWDMIVVTVFISILNQIKFHLVQNRKEDCHHDHIPFNLKGIGNVVFSVFLSWRCPQADSFAENCRKIHNKFKFA